MEPLKINIAGQNPGEMFCLQQTTIDLLGYAIHAGMQKWAAGEMTAGAVILQVCDQAATPEEQAFCITMLSSAMTRATIIAQMEQLEEAEMEAMHQEQTGRTKSGIIVDLTKG